jgi:type I restriction enzyme S subunit
MCDPHAATSDEILLGSLTRGYRGVSYRPEDLRAAADSQTATLLRATNIQNGSLDLREVQFVPAAIVAPTQVLEPGDIAVCMSNGSKVLVGKSAPFRGDVTGKFTVGAFCSVFKPIDRDAKDLLVHLFRSKPYLKAIDIALAGSAINNLKNSDVERVRFRLPARALWQRIATILTSIDNAIETTEALIEKRLQIKAGLMHDLFTRGLNESGELRPRQVDAPDQYQQSPIGWLPKSWSVSTVRACGDVKLGRQRSPGMHTGRWSTPYLRVANVFDGYIDFSDVLWMDFTPSEREAFNLSAGDILLNEGQSLDLVGRSAVYRGEENRFCFQNTLVRFRCSRDHDPGFFAALFKRWLDNGQFQRIAKQTTSVAHLGADRFARLLCPSVPLAEQRLIAERLGAADRLLESERAQLSKLRNQKLGLMQDLLTGRVSVKIPDSTLEPSIA